MGKRYFLDLQDHRLSCYSFEKDGPENVFTVPVSADRSFSIDRTFTVSDEAFLSLPLSLLDFRVLELPFSDVGKIRDLVPLEIDGIVLGGSAAAVFDVLIIDRGDDKCRVLVAYVSKDAMRSVLAGVNAAGLDPKAVTSIELSHAVRSASSSEEVSGLLLSPPAISGDERTSEVMREMRGPTVNFRRGEFRYTADTEKAKKSLIVTAVLASLLFLVVLSDAGMNVVAAYKEVNSIRGAMRKTYQGLFPGEKKINNELHQLKAHIKELREKEASFIGISPLDALLDLSRYSRPGISLTEISVDKDLIVLKGEGPSPGDVQTMKNALGASFREVNISDTRPSANNRTLFTITAKGRKA